MSPFSNRLCFDPSHPDQLLPFAQTAGGHPGGTGLFHNRGLKCCPAPAPAPAPSRGNLSCPLTGEEGGLGSGPSPSPEAEGLCKVARDSLFRKMGTAWTLSPSSRGSPGFSCTFLEASPLAACSLLRDWPALQLPLWTAPGPAGHTPGAPARGWALALPLWCCRSGSCRDCPSNTCLLLSAVLRGFRLGHTLAPPSVLGVWEEDFCVLGTGLLLPSPGQGACRCLRESPRFPRLPGSPAPRPCPRALPASLSVLLSGDSGRQGHPGRPVPWLRGQEAARTLPTGPHAAPAARSWRLSPRSVLTLLPCGRDTGTSLRGAS